ncbi:MarR family transcriptional regulator [Spirosoma sp. KCTC 42546]|uniref:MarR family winged helix-turn-helix transcriptional regulator n=1 Tax=Spirosoma sp. KCTC 42546 TaxID=2520506 RepID=UPI001157FC09|nr:MarR family transcriptional regulator [Spirosoma sp. KCTC 42546]QDK80629.1 MarR family transcriptional regulator [Spirosoma sp. KCTC 42546]
MPSPPQHDQELSTELRTVVTRLIKKLRTQSPTHAKLSLTERSVIKLLDKQKEMLPNEIAKMEKVTTQSMSQILNHLLALGYITRNPSKIDKRKVLISLSETGEAILHAVRNEVDEWLTKAIQETCSTEDKAILRQALVPLSKLLEVD